MRRLTLTLLVLATALVLVPSASASTVRVSRHLENSSETSSFRGEVVFRAGRHERNRVQIRLVSHRRVVVSDRVRLHAGHHCRRLSRHRAICGLGHENGADNFYGATVRLGDRSDRLRFRGDPTGFYNSTSLSGGSGDDELLGSRAEVNSFAGGSGNDRMIGGPGQDIFDEGRAASGQDRIGGRGGDGDTVNYSRRSQRVVADLAGDRDDGQAGELDKIGSDVEDIDGGRAGNDLTGNSAANSLLGGDGDDTLTGGGGVDNLDGGAGNDRLVAADGGTADSVFCGNGIDRAELDAADPVTPASSCEVVVRSP